MSIFIKDKTLPLFSYQICCIFLFQFLRKRDITLGVLLTNAERDLSGRMIINHAIKQN